MNKYKYDKCIASGSKDGVLIITREREIILNK